MTRLFFCLLIFISCATSAQIVNTESQRMQSDSIGWMGTMATSFSFIKNVQEVTSLDALVHVQYKTKKDLWLFLVNYDFLKGNGQELTNNVFYHLRYNHKIRDWLRWELFTQLQKNAITGIDLRLLAGTGPRIRLTESKRLKLYAGTAAMYEYEKEQTDPFLYHRHIRSSNYLSLSYVPNPVIEFINTGFYQPLFKKPADYRFLDELRIDVKAGRHFSIVTTMDYLYDSFPAAHTPHANYGITNGLDYAF
jgi:hypothetical protein